MTNTIYMKEEPESQSMIKELAPSDAAIIIHEDGIHEFHLGPEAPDWHTRAMAMLMYFINAEGDESVDAVRDRFFDSDSDIDPAELFDELCEKYRVRLH